MSKFSDYTPIRPRDATLAIGLRIDQARASDLDANTTLTAEGGGGEPERYMESLMA